FSTTTAAPTRHVHSGRTHCNAKSRACGLFLESKDGPELSALILPLIGRMSGDRVGHADVGQVWQKSGLILRLFECERDVRIQFVVESRGQHSGLQKRQSAVAWRKAVCARAAEAVRVSEIVVDDLILASMQVKIPGCVMPLWVRIEPAGQR